MKLRSPNASLAHVSPDLFLAANTMGGVIGKMISPQSLAIAAVTTGEHESSLFRRLSLGYRHAGSSLRTGIRRIQRSLLYPSVAFG